VGPNNRIAKEIRSVLMAQNKGLNAEAGVMRLVALKQIAESIRIHCGCVDFVR